MKIKLYIICFMLFAVIAGDLPLIGQNVATPKDRKPTKAWELGIGGSVYQFSRTTFSNFTKGDNGYQFDLRLGHAVYGGNLYLARELNSHFYLDLQGTVGATTESLSNNDKSKWFYMIGSGLQWRFGGYFGSKYIDPYLRAGVSYMYKDFSVFYTGKEGLSTDEVEWVIQNMKNKEGADRRDLMPVSVGVGLNTWLNDNIGIGLQGDYLIMPYGGVANTMQGTVRVMWRIGGKTKKPATMVEYIEIEKIVEVPVEKIVEFPVESVNEKQVAQLCDFFNNISFGFNKTDITTESEKVIDQIASVIMKDTSRRYLITGYTDARGSQDYNEKLSANRAASVVNALLKRGIPKSILKSRGVGKSASYASAGASDDVREGDRKVTIEVITNMYYWDYLK